MMPNGRFCARAKCSVRTYEFRLNSRNKMQIRRRATENKIRLKETGLISFLKSGLFQHTVSTYNFISSSFEEIKWNSVR